MKSCVVCGKVSADQCHQDWLEDKMSVRISRQYDDRQPQWRSKERVYVNREDGHGQRLLYAEGAPIPEEEARRQGLIEPEPKGKKADGDKAKKGAPNKGTASPDEE